MNRISNFSNWFHVIQTQLPKGKSMVLVTVCTRQSAEKYITSLQNVQKQKQKEYVYSIDSTSNTNPIRRCDLCRCGK